jgi:hypothetical protein
MRRDAKFRRFILNNFTSEMGVLKKLKIFESYSFIASQSGAAPHTGNVNSWYVNRKQHQDISVTYLNIRSLAYVWSKEPQTLSLVQARTNFAFDYGSCVWNVKTANRNVKTANIIVKTANRIVKTANRNVDNWLTVHRRINLTQWK